MLQVLVIDDIYHVYSQRLVINKCNKCLNGTSNYDLLIKTQNNKGLNSLLFLI